MTVDERHLSATMEMVIALASKDFSRRLEVNDESELFDAVATGLNMLAEELQLGQQHERDLQKQVLDAERLAAVGQLAAGVAHEVNNPASFVLANAGLLGDNVGKLGAFVDELEQLFPDTSTEGQRVRALTSRWEVRALLGASREMLGDSKDGMERIVAIASQLRTYARKENEALAPVDLEQVVNEACKLVGKQLTYRARLVRRLGVVPPVSANHGQLVQVLTNLLLNAVHATPEGEPERHEIEVGTDATGDEARLWVRDTGSGMSPEVRERIFEPFFTTKAVARGMGLGLAVSAELVRKHGGRLEVETAPGKGSRFLVRLPLGRSPEVRAKSAAPPPASPGRSRPRVLLVDDEELLLRVYKRMLGGRYDVSVAASGAEALELLRAGPFDAILCDLMMPGIDGVALHEALRAEHPELLERIAFLSGGTYTPRTQAFAEQLGARLLHKPVGRPELEAVLDRLVG